MCFQSSVIPLFHCCGVREYLIQLFSPCLGIGAAMLWNYLHFTFMDYGPVIKTLETL